MDNHFIESHINCTIEEKMELLPTIRLLMELAGTARREGMVRIQEVLEQELSSAPGFLTFGIQLIADGRDPDRIRQIMEGYLLSSQWNGARFLENIVIMETVLAIQQGYGLLEIREIASSFFGFEFRTAIGKMLMENGLYEDESRRLSEKEIFKLLGYQDTNSEMDQRNKKSEREKERKSENREENEEPDFLPSLMVFFQGKKALSPRTNLLSVFKGISNQGMKRLLQELEMSDLVLALAGASEEEIRMVLKNLSPRTAQMTAEGILSIRYTEESCVMAQTKIVLILETLIREGEISRETF